MSCLERKSGSRWVFVTHRYYHVGCYFKWKWQARLHRAVGHFEPGKVITIQEFDRRKRRWLKEAS